MVNIMGVALSDKQPAKIALTGIYGVGRMVAKQLCARLQIHENCKLTELTPQQTTALTAFLSAPGNAPLLSTLPLASIHHRPAFKTNLIDIEPPKNTTELLLPQPEAESAGSTSKSVSSPTGSPPPIPSQSDKNIGVGDRLRQLKIETDLRRYVRENIMHHRIINSYIGRRHAMGLPVRGQRTNTNAQTARRLNKLDRRG
ncbi:hypothetical protein FRB91_010898 [Serendipita sp. 411]|nr:hypothetical protein FRB91_010898 [Serendipita sp. 411]